MTIGLRIWAPAAGLGIAVVLAGGWFIGAQPMIASAAANDQSRTTLEATNQASRIRLVQLTKQAAKIDSMRAEDAVLQKAVPTILKPNTFIRRINEIAALDDVTVVSVVPSPASAYVAAPSLLAGGASTAAPALGKTDPSITAANFTVVPISVSVSGGADAVVEFAHDLQNDERVFAISSVQTTKDDKGVVAASFGGSIYTLAR